MKLRSILETGIKDGLDPLQKREIRILNLFSVIIFSGLLIGFTNYFFLGKDYPMFFEFIVGVASLSILIQNYKGFHESAAYTFVITLNVALFFISKYYDPSIATYIYYFPFIFCTSLLYNPNKSKYRIFIFFLMILIGFILSLILETEAFRNTNITEEQNKLLFKYNIYFCVVVTIALVYVVIRQLNTQYHELSSLFDTVKKDKVIIENSLKEKDVLLAEIQHRVKNNMSVIIGLFNLQKESSSNEETRIAMTEARNRVLSIAMVHERLYKKTDLSRIDLKNYIMELTDEVIKSFPIHNKIKTSFDLLAIQMEITRAVPIGLIINEAITNSIKHGFKGGQTDPLIGISLTHQFGNIVLKISDNGTGMEEKPKQDSLGMILMSSLADQLDGEIMVYNDKGTTIKLSFPY